LPSKISPIAERIRINHVVVIIFFFVILLVFVVLKVIVERGRREVYAGNKANICPATSKGRRRLDGEATIKAFTESLWWHTTSSARIITPPVAITLLFGTLKLLVIVDLILVL